MPTAGPRGCRVGRGPASARARPPPAGRAPLPTSRRARTRGADPWPGRHRPTKLAATSHPRPRRDGVRRTAEPTPRPSSPTSADPSSGPPVRVALSGPRRSQETRSRHSHQRRAPEAPRHCETHAATGPADDPWTVLARGSSRSRSSSSRSTCSCGSASGATAPGGAAARASPYAHHAARAAAHGKPGHRRTTFVVRESAHADERLSRGRGEAVSFGWRRRNPVLRRARQDGVLPWIGGQGSRPRALLRRELASDH